MSIIIYAVAIGFTWLILSTFVWAFIAGAHKINERWDRSNNASYADWVRRDAEARSLAFGDGNAESPRESEMGHKMELRTGGICPTGEIRWSGREASAPEDSVWTRGVGDPRGHDT